MDHGITNFGAAHDAAVVQQPNDGHTQNKNASPLAIAFGKKVQKAQTAIITPTEDADVADVADGTSVPDELLLPSAEEPELVADVANAAWARAPTDGAVPTAPVSDLVSEPSATTTAESTPATATPTKNVTKKKNSNGPRGRRNDPYRRYPSAQMGSPLLQAPVPRYYGNSVTVEYRGKQPTDVRILNTVTGTGVLVSTALFANTAPNELLRMYGNVPLLGEALFDALSPFRDFATHAGAVRRATRSNHRQSHARMVAHLLHARGVGLEHLCAAFLALDIGKTAFRDTTPFHPFGKAASRAKNLASVFIGQLPRSYTAVDVALVLFALTGIMPVMVKLVDSRGDAKNTIGGAIVDFNRCDRLGPNSTAVDAAVHAAKHNHCAVLGDFGAFIGSEHDGAVIKQWVHFRNADLVAKHGLAKNELGVGAMTIELSNRTKDALAVARATA